jgi:hypothetical protein
MQEQPLSQTSATVYVFNLPVQRRSMEGDNDFICDLNLPSSEILRFVGWHLNFVALKICVTWRDL